jgi:hypothetical protein
MQAEATLLVAIPVPRPTPHSRARIAFRGMTPGADGSARLSARAQSPRSSCPRGWTAPPFQATFTSMDFGLTTGDFGTCT